MGVHEGGGPLELVLAGESVPASTFRVIDCSRREVSSPAESSLDKPSSASPRTASATGS